MAHSFSLFLSRSDQDDKPTDYENFKAMVAGHYGFLAHHEKYITRILDGKITNDEEIDEYLDEIIGASYKKSIFSRKECLERIQGHLRYRMDYFKIIYSAALERPTEANLLSLYFLMGILLKDDRVFQNRKIATIETLIDFALYNHNQIQELHTVLKQLLPKAYQQMKNIVSYVELPAIIKKIKQTNFEDIYQCYTIAYTWAGLVMNYLDSYAQPIAVTEKEQEMSNIIARLLELQKSFDAYIFTKKLSPPPKSNYENFLDQKTTLDTIIPLVLEGFTLLERQKALVEEAHKFIIKQQILKAKQICWPEMKNLTEELTIKYQDTAKAAAQFPTQTDIQEKLKHVARRLEKLVEILNDSSASLFTSEAEVKAEYERFKNEKVDLIKKMKQIRQLAGKLRRSDQQNEKEKNEEKEEKVEPTIGIVKHGISKESKEFQQKKADETRQWKDKVAEDREKKEIKKAEAAKALVPTSLKQELHKVTNPAAKQLLMALILQPKKHQLLRDILTLQKGIRYSSAYRLIVSSLKGDISGTKTGGSHRRVRIGKVFTEILATNLIDPDMDEITSDEEVAESSTPHPSFSPAAQYGTGGLFRPHKTGHNSGHNSNKLSPSNVELLARALNNAGITMKLLDGYVKEIQDAVSSEATKHEAPLHT